MFLFVFLGCVFGACCADFPDVVGSVELFVVFFGFNLEKYRVFVEIRLFSYNSCYDSVFSVQYYFAYLSGERVGVYHRGCMLAYRGPICRGSMCALGTIDVHRIHCLCAKVHVGCIATVWSRARRSSMHVQ